MPRALLHEADGRENTDIPGGDSTANTAADLLSFRLYSSGIPRERFSTAPDGSTDNTSPSRGVMRYIGTWGGAYVPALTMAVNDNTSPAPGGNDAGAQTGVVLGWCVVMNVVSLQKAGICAGGAHGSGVMPQLLSTGEGEHSKARPQSRRQLLRFREHSR